jgi:hypothetical protein
LILNQVANVADGHRLRHRERSDAFRALAAGGIGGFHDGARRRAAGAHDDAGADVRDLGGLEPGIPDRLLHGNVIPGRAFTEEAHGAPIDDFGGVDLRRALDLAAESEFGILFRAADAGFRVVKARQHFLCVVSDG